MKLRSPFDDNMALLAKVLDLRSQNQQVIASNIANAETPGYSPAKFEFENALKTAVKAKESMPLAQSHPGHLGLGATTIEDVQGTVHITPDSTGIGDKNGVKIDAEMMALSENQILYEASAQLLKKKMAMLKYSISGGQ